MSRKLSGFTCTVCGHDILMGESHEPWSINDPRHVHSTCIGKLIAEILEHMKRVPPHRRFSEADAGQDDGDDTGRDKFDI